MKFEPGKTYEARNSCDHECIFRFEVLKRTAKTLTLKYYGETFRRGIYMYEGREHCRPLGYYSMCPIISA